jgi:hypothetical protein
MPLKMVKGKLRRVPVEATHETIVIDRRLFAVLHHLAARLTSIEQQIATITNSAPAPPTSSADHCRNCAAFKLRKYH